MSSVPERPDDDRDEADGVESSDDERRAREAETAEAGERDNPVAAALTPEQYAAFVGVLARLVRSAAARLARVEGER